MKLKIIKKEYLINKIGVLIGTRPSFMKMGPIINELIKKNIDHFVIHAGQHYSYNMNEIFINQIKIPKPNYFLDSLKNYTLHGEQTAEMLKFIEKILIEEKPKILLVCGDANFNFAGALAARKLQIKVGHVESGLRSNDWRMPEEHNRVMIDHISEYLFAPTEEARRNLIEDNVKGKIIVVGNTIVDAVLQNISLSKKSQISIENNLVSKKYVVITFHREENVDNKEILIKIIEGIKNICIKYKKYKFIAPLHPRTINRLKQFNLLESLKIENLIIIEPMGYIDFLNLINNARIIMTDSGGIQEEACILKVPCVTLRENTERPETITVGSNIIVGNEPVRIMKGFEKMLKIKPDWEIPYGDGTAAKQIVQIIYNELIK